MSWLRPVPPKESSVITPRGETDKGTRLAKPDGPPSMVDFLPKDILDELTEDKDCGP